MSKATPGSSTDSLLQQVIGTLTGDATGAAGIGMWRGADEPWWSGISPATLQFAYCRSTGHGDPSWCAGEPRLDQDHLWVTVEAPRGTASDLAPYSAVTDVHGVDDYPVTLAATDPDLHQVGSWTSTMAAATPSHALWTSLQVCASGSSNASGTFVFGGALHGPDAATVVRESDGDVVMTDGPFVEAKEHVAGFYIINADDLDAALAWARKVVDAIDHPIEVRPFRATGRVQA